MRADLQTPIRTVCCGCNAVLREGATLRGLASSGLCAQCRDRIYGRPSQADALRAAVDKDGSDAR